MEREMGRRKKDGGGEGDRDKGDGTDGGEKIEVEGERERRDKRGGKDGRERGREEE